MDRIGLKLSEAPDGPEVGRRRVVVRGRVWVVV